MMTAVHENGYVFFTAVVNYGKSGYPSYDTITWRQVGIQVQEKQIFENKYNFT